MIIANGWSGGGRPTLDQGNFGSGIQLAKVYLIHEGAHEKDAAAGGSEEIFWRKRVGNGVKVEAGALVGDRDDEGVGGDFEGCGDAFGGVVGVAVDDSVGGGFAGDHGKIGGDARVKSGGLGEFECGVLNGGHAGEGGIEREAYAACGSVGQCAP